MFMASKRTDILLVGKTGHGKSATANSIVGFNAFKSGGDFDAITKEAQFENAEFEGRAIKVVDSPGTSDTTLQKHAAVKLVIDAMTTAVAANPSGYHCILLVMKYGVRFTKEELDTVRLLKDIFGENFIKNHAILVLTHGDNFANDEEFNTFEKWVSSQTGEFKMLVNECCGRVILFNNKLTNLETKKGQLRKLLKMIDNLTANGSCYTSSIFHEAQKSRERALSESKRQTLGDDIFIEFGIINQQLNCSENEPPEKAMILLQSLKERAEIVEQKVKRQDQGRGSLRVAITLAEQLNETINDIIKAKVELLQEQRKLELGNLQLKERHRSEEEEQNKKERERKSKKESEKRTLNKELERERRERKQEEMKQKMKSIKENYEALKIEETRFWTSVASSILGSALRLTKSWFK